MSTLAEANALLEAQRALFSGDDHIRREVAPWLDATPAQRLLALDALSRDTVRWLARLSPEALERATAPTPLPDDALPILQVLLRGAR